MCFWKSGIVGSNRLHPKTMQECNVHAVPDQSQMNKPFNYVPAVAGCGVFWSTC